jgi:hypothetical protein
MTKRSFFWNIIIVIIILLFTIAGGIYLSIIDTTEKRQIYTTYKDLIPLLLAIVASWLTYCIQRRTSYTQHLRNLWSKTIEAVQAATQYTHIKSRDQTLYSNTLLKLSIVIDEIRGVYKNIKDKGEDAGYYPFEPIKEIYTLITDMGYDNEYNEQKAKIIRTSIFTLWKSMRKEFLKEMDRDTPTFSHSHWVDTEKLTLTNGRRPRS